jgi:hypothetical protein
MTVAAVKLLDDLGKYVVSGVIGSPQDGKSAATTHLP